MTTWIIIAVGYAAGMGLFHLLGGSAPLAGVRAVGRNQLRAQGRAGLTEFLAEVGTTQAHLTEPASSPCTK